VLVLGCAGSAGKAVVHNAITIVVETVANFFFWGLRRAAGPTHVRVTGGDAVAEPELVG
jgi:hypothetical protein